MVFSAISNAYISTFEPAHEIWVLILYVQKYRKTCIKRPLSKGPKIGFKDQLSLNVCKKYCRMPSSSQKDRKLFLKTNYHLMQVKSIAECSKGSILQYFRRSLIYHL